MNEEHPTEELWRALTDLMASQGLAVLATHDHGQPYTSLMAFACSGDLKAIFFATGTATRKYANLKSDPRAAMMIDNRSNAPSDFAKALAVTATGAVDVASDDELIALRNIFLEKHPHLSDFATSPSTQLMRLNVSCYYVVSRFQNVVELRMGR